MDADDIFWLPTNPPFREKRERGERFKLLRQALASNRTVVAGSIIGWGQEIEDAFDAIVFLRAPAEVRVSRLRKRELALLGHVNEEFITWTVQYDVGTMDGRSLGRHLAWLEERRCQILRLSGVTRVSELVSIVREQVST